MGRQFDYKALLFEGLIAAIEIFFLWVPTGKMD
jgi:hypothetical protein